MNYPNTVKIEVLDEPNRGYCADKLAKYWALYAGGEDFRALIDEMIIKREIEKRRTDLGMRSYEERKKFAAYVNRLGGFIDGMVAEITGDGVYIVLPEGGSEEQTDYYTGINLNADGYGAPLTKIVRKVLADEMISRNAWLDIRADEEDQRNLYIGRTNPVQVIDWFDGFAKDKRCEEYRDPAEPYLPTDLTRVQWILFDAEGVTVYEALRRGDQYVDPTTNTKTQEARQVDVAPTDFGMQLRSISAERSQWVADRVADTVILLFNKELDLSFSLAEAAYPQLVLKVEDRSKLEELVKSELNVVSLDIGDTLEYLKVDPQTFIPLQENIKSLKAAINETIQSTARDAASIPQAGRMSGETVREMRAPMDSLRYSFAWPVYECLMRIIEDIKTFRNEPELKVDIVGLIDNNAIIEQQESENDEDEEEYEDGRAGPETGSEEGNEEDRSEEESF